VVYITCTPAIPSCFMDFFSDPYSPFEIFNFLLHYVVYFLFFIIHLFIIGLDCQVSYFHKSFNLAEYACYMTHKFVADTKSCTKSTFHRDD